MIIAVTDASEVVLADAKGDAILDVRLVLAVLETVLAVRLVEVVPAAVESVEDLVKQGAQDHAVRRAKQPAHQHAITPAPERVLQSR